MTFDFGRRECKVVAMKNILFFKTRAKILEWLRGATFVAIIPTDNEFTVSKVFAYDGKSWRVDFYDNGNPFLGHVDLGEQSEYGYCATQVEYREIIVAPRFEWVPASSSETK